jgi:hypothetical protein
VDALSFILHRDNAYSIGKELCRSENQLVYPASSVLFCSKHRNPVLGWFVTKQLVCDLAHMNTSFVNCQSHEVSSVVLLWIIWVVLFWFSSDFLDDATVCIAGSSG